MVYLIEQEDMEATEPDEGESDGGGKGITKAEAVRRALAAGKESPEEGVDYIKRQFGIDMAKQHFSASKSQIKRRGREVEPAPKAPEPRKRQPLVEDYVAPP